MNVYVALNELIEYIENHLTDEISYSKLATFLGTNEYTMQSLFTLLCNISIADYIRMRRLSEAGFDIYKSNAKIIDIALKYQYENPTSFSRAFEKFHGIKPSQVKSHPEKLKVYTKIVFNEQISISTEKIEYSIVELDELTLYGKYINTTFETISKDAPNFWQKMFREYPQYYDILDYGMTVYLDNELENNDRFSTKHYEYWISSKIPLPDFKKYTLPKSKWLKLSVSSYLPKDIHELVLKFYLSFLPSCKYNIKSLPELEYYHDGMADFLVAIED